MIKRFSYSVFLLLLPLLFLQCEEERENKIDYEGTLNYFPDQFGIEHFINEEVPNTASIILPECFYKNYTALSLTDENNFFCSDNRVYFSVDVIPKSEINFYAEYFNDEKTKEQKGIKIIRDYIMEIRAYGLTNFSRSIYSSLSTKNGIKMLLGSVKGYRNTEEKELFYQFGVVEAKDNYYVLQSVTSVKNTSFLQEDLMTIFKSFKIH